MEDYQIFKHIPKNYTAMGEIFCRKGTLDTFVVNEQDGEYGTINSFVGKTVMDIGANIGAFSRYAIARGAKSVIAFEPDPDNYKMLLLNTVNVPVACNNLAVVADEDPEELELYIASGKNKGQHTLRKTRGRKTVKVKTVKLSPLLDCIRPDILKVDVEGYEHKLFSEDLLFWPDELVMEIHLHKPEFEKASLTTVNNIKKFGNYNKWVGLLKVMFSEHDVQDDTIHFLRE